MRNGTGLAQFVERELCTFVACVELRRAKVNGVGAIGDSSPHGVERAGGREKFGDDLMGRSDVGSAYHATNLTGPGPALAGNPLSRRFSPSYEPKQVGHRQASDGNPTHKWDVVPNTVAEDQHGYDAQRELDAGEVRELNVTCSRVARPSRRRRQSGCLRFAVRYVEHQP